MRSNQNRASKGKCMAKHRTARVASLHASRSSFVAGSVGAFATFGIVKSPAKAVQFNFKCASNFPPDHPASIRQVQMWDAVERESGGRIHTQSFPNSELGSDSAMLTQLRLGALQFFLIGIGNIASVVPAANISSLGFAFKDEDEGLRIMAGPLGDFVRTEITAKGMHGLRMLWDGGMKDVCSASRPIRVPEDLRGFKIRVNGSRILTDLFKDLGASPTPLSFDEIYTALQTKLVNGNDASLVTIETARFFEVAKYCSLTHHAWAGTWLVANGDAWKSLPASIQDIIERNNTKYSAIQRMDTKSLSASLGAKLTGQGMTLNQVDQAPFRSSLRSYYQDWAGTFGPSAWGLMETSIGHKLIS
jgi:TRAP-type transport system periplasmic protein